MNFLYFLDAPPMLLKLSDGETLATFDHNRHSDCDYTCLSGAKAEMMCDRSKIWLSTSADSGHSWSAPRFVFANALGEAFACPFRNYQCSYMDCIVAGGVVHLFVPYRWQRVLHLTISKADLGNLPLTEDLA